MMKLSIIVPAHNEEDNIVEVINKIESSVSAPHELVIVDDHSVDKTACLVKELMGKFKGIKLIENRRDRGFANAVRTGFDNASFDAVIPVMADLCDDLDTIDKLFDKINQGFDVACGSRYSKGGLRLGGSRLKAFLSSFGGRSIRLLLGIPTHDIANAFKMYRKNVIDSISIESKSFEISMELPLKAYFKGFHITEVPTVWKERTKGKSSFKVFKLLPGYIKLYIWAILKRIKGY